MNKREKVICVEDAQDGEVVLTSKDGVPNDQEIVSMIDRHSRRKAVKKVHEKVADWIKMERASQKKLLKQQKKDSQEAEQRRRDEVSAADTAGTELVVSAVVKVLSGVASEERKKKAEEREAKEAEEARLAEQERRNAIAAARIEREEKALSQPGLSHRPCRARDLNHPVRGPEKPVRIEQARQHEIALKEAEEARKAEQEARLEMIRKGDWIMRGL